MTRKEKIARGKKSMHMDFRIKQEIILWLGDQLGLWKDLYCLQGVSDMDLAYIFQELKKLP